MFRKFTIYLAAVVVICIVGALLLDILLKPAEGTLAFELIKALLQVGVVTALGALVSLFTFEHQQERQRQEREREEKEMRIEKEKELGRQQIDKERELESKRLEYREKLLEAILNQATDSYSAVKKARRLLKARTIIRETGSKQELVLGGDYDIYMDTLNDAQLSFEHLVGDVLTSKQAFTDPVTLEIKFRSIEGYLERLINEYEDNRRAFAGEPPSKELASLRKLSDFLGPSKPSEFRTQVIEPYHQVQQAIRSYLLHPELPQAKQA